MIMITVVDTAWKIDGFKKFYEMCIAWAEEEAKLRPATYALEFWVSNERFPVLRFLFEKHRIVELFYYPQNNTAACLSGKALHDSTKKLDVKCNILRPYREKECPDICIDG